MQEENKLIFKDLILRTHPFKGRVNLYYCFLKSEKLAIVLSDIFSGGVFREHEMVHELLSQTSKLPLAIARSASGEVPEGTVISAILGIISGVRILVADRVLAQGNGEIIIAEYERVAERMISSLPVSYLTVGDFALPDLPEPRALPNSPGSLKGQFKGQQGGLPAPSKKAEAVLKYVRDNKRVTVKDISRNIREYSEKTIQRELAALMRSGLVKKEGERRWSVYLPV